MSSQHFIRPLWIIAQFELVRLFATRRGLLTLFTFFVVWYFLLTGLIMTAADFIQQNASSNTSNMMLKSIGLDGLFTWPIAEFSAYWHLSLYLFPLFCVPFSANQTASDRARGSLRFLTIRCSKSSLFLGRFVGQVIAQSLLVFVTLLSTFTVVISQNFNACLPSLECLLLIFTNLILILLPFTAMMALLSAAVRSPLMAMVLAVLLWTILSASLSTIGTHWPALSFLHFVIPGVHLADLAKLKPFETFSLAYIPILQTLLLLSAGLFVMKKANV